MKKLIFLLFLSCSTLSEPTPTHPWTRCSYDEYGRFERVLILSETADKYELKKLDNPIFDKNGENRILSVEKSRLKLRPCPMTWGD